MAEVMVRTTAVRWVSDDFPGWIELVIADAEKHLHRVVERVPVLSADDITAASDFPSELWLRAECDLVDEECAVIRFSHGVTTTEGVDQLRMGKDSIRWL